jgi:hypothetical protein
MGNDGRRWQDWGTIVLSILYIPLHTPDYFAPAPGSYFSWLNSLQTSLSILALGSGAAPFRRYLSSQLQDGQDRSRPRALNLYGGYVASLGLGVVTIVTAGQREGLVAHVRNTPGCNGHGFAVLVLGVPLLMMRIISAPSRIRRRQRMSGLVASLWDLLNQRNHFNLQSVLEMWKHSHGTHSQIRYPGPEVERNLLHTDEHGGQNLRPKHPVHF